LFSLRIVYNIFFGFSSKNPFEIIKVFRYNNYRNDRYSGEDSGYVSGK